MPPWAIVLILAFLLGLGACCVVCVVLYRRAREQTDPVLLIEQQIKEQEALSSDIPSPRHSVDISVGYCEDEWTQCTEYDEARQATWCIPYADLTLEHELAASRYGEVWRAKWTCFGECTNVADLAGKSPRGRGRRKSFEPKVRPVAVKKITRLRASAHLKVRHRLQRCVHCGNSDRQAWLLAGVHRRSEHAAHAIAPERGQVLWRVCRVEVPCTCHRLLATRLPLRSPARSDRAYALSPPVRFRRGRLARSLASHPLADDSGRRRTALACAQKCTPISLNRRIRVAQ